MARSMDHLSIPQVTGRIQQQHCISKTRLNRANTLSLGLLIDCMFLLRIPPEVNSVNIVLCLLRERRSRSHNKHKTIFG